MARFTVISRRMITSPTIYRVLLPLVIAASLVAAEPALKSQVLVLVGGGVMEGDIERLGDRYRIRRGDSETKLPAEQVLFVAEDLKSVYRVLEERVPPDNSEEHLKLARWCFTNHLRDEAITQANIAVRLAPRSTQAQVYLRHLQNAETPSTPPPAKAESTVAKSTDIECSAEAMRLFHAKVQPILNNTCAACHVGNRAGSFELHRSNDPTADEAFNVAASLKQVNRSNLRQSPLLVKATTAHGNSNRPPIKDANAPAFKFVEQWVKLATLENHAPPATASANVGSVSKLTAGAKDPFDPEIFNRIK
ncbi:MAG: hypothetical protein ACJ8C4_02275 [Gemmataceae bacterium]